MLKFELNALSGSVTKFGLDVLYVAQQCASITIVEFSTVGIRLPALLLLEPSIYRTSSPLKARKDPVYAHFHYIYGPLDYSFTELFVR